MEIMVSKTKPHDVEMAAVDLVRDAVNKNGAVFRELTGRDYGIDGLAEIFDEGKITGRFALLQIKGSLKEYVPRRNNMVSRKVRDTTYRYTEQRNIPVVAIAVDTKNEQFYFQDLVVAKRKGSTTYLPKENCCLKEQGDFIKWLLDVVDSYYGTKSNL